MRRNAFFLYKKRRHSLGEQRRRQLLGTHERGDGSIEGFSSEEDADQDSVEHEEFLHQRELFRRHEDGFGPIDEA